jgi:predicted transcriptional regulator of viral defense system
MNKLLLLNKTNKKIFSTQDLGVIWQEADKRKLLESIKYYLRTNQIYQISRGIYSIEKYNAKDIEENIELSFKIAQKMSPNSYISLYTAMKYHGLIFQYYDDIYSIGERNIKREVFNVKFIYKTMKDDIFRNDIGIYDREGYRIASKERSFCDSLYLFPNIGVDNIDILDKDMVWEISEIYENKSLNKRIKLLLK